MSVRALSIRTVLLLIISALTLLITILAAREVYLRWQHLERIEALKKSTSISDSLFRAMENLSTERDIAYTMLYMTDEETMKNLHARLEKHRVEADETVQSAQEALAEYRFSELQPLQEKINVHLSNIKNLRQRIDRATILPYGQRDPELARLWYDEVTQLTGQTQDLWIGFIKYFTDIDPIVTQRLRYNHFLRTITDYTGRERAIIGRMIAENADPSPEEAAMLLRGQGTVELGWSFSQLLASQSGLFPAVLPYFLDAKNHHETLHTMMHSTFFIPGARRGASYPVSAEMWLELSDQAAESLRALKLVSRKETWLYVEKLERNEQRTILFHALFLILAFIICIYSFRLVTDRVTRPLNIMIDVLLRAIRGNPVSFTLPQGKQLAEIGQLAEMLEAFQKNVEMVRRASESVARSENRLRAVVDYVLDGLITINQKGIIQTFNPACERIFGYEAAEVLGQNVKVLMPEPYHSEHDGYLSHYVTTGEKHIIGTPGREVRGRRKDGTIFPMDLSVSAFQLEDGQYFSGIVRDITERKSAEAQLLRYTRELERSNQELDDFAYIASHDLKEPLRGLFNHASFLLEDYTGKLDEDGVRRLNRLSHLAQRMEHLVNDLLYFSRLGRSELAVQETNLNAVITDIEQMMESSLREKNAHIIVPAPLPTIVCDKPRITEVFRNLITNAIKYNDKPERTVEIGFLDTVDTPQGTEKNVFYVKDNGIGIEEGFYQEIFRIFKRLQRTESQEEGTGVGLTFVKKIIERHKGRIWLDSHPGDGTTFYFTIGRKDQ